MKVLTQKSETTSLISSLKSQGKTVALVPTMGYLHDGHLNLVKKAKSLCDIVVVSIFVNPTQFGENEDFDKYPSDIESDKQKLEGLGVDFLFNPKSEDIYTKNAMISLNPGKTANLLCGEFRKGHFDGVLTIVNKLFNIVQPNVAVFGKKDAQQLIIIEKMVDDLDIDIEIVPVDTVREASGLAMSSRNTYLTDKEKNDATIINKSLSKAKLLIASGENDVDVIKNVIKENISTIDCKIEYIEAIDTKSFELCKIVDTNTLFAVAVYVNKTRLIDNFFVKDITEN